VPIKWKCKKYLKLVSKLRVVDCGFAKENNFANMMFPLKLADSLWKAKS
jgi:hypothetical protein